MKTLLKSVSLIAVGIVLGVAIERGVMSAAPAQQREGGGRRGPAPLTMEQLPAEVAQLKALVPSNSHIMMDVQLHWTNLWWAGEEEELAARAVLLQRGARPHPVADPASRPIMKSQLDQKDVDIAGDLRRHRHEQPRRRQDGHREEGQRGVRGDLQDDARELLRVPQERRAAVPPADDPDAPDAGDPQHGSGRDLAGMTLRAVALA